MDSIERKYVKRRLAIVFCTSLLFILMYTCGAQDHVSVLAGAHSGSGWEQMLGFLYVILYLMMISIIPILGYNWDCPSATWIFDYTSSKWFPENRLNLTNAIGTVLTFMLIHAQLASTSLSFEC